MHVRRSRPLSLALIVSLLSAMWPPVVRAEQSPPDPLLPEQAYESGTPAWWAYQRDTWIPVRPPAVTPPAPDATGMPLTPPAAIPVPRADTTGPETPGLVITLDVPPDPLAVGDIVTVRLTVTNRASTIADSVQLVLPLPDATTLATGPPTTLTPTPPLPVPTVAPDLSGDGGSAAALDVTTTTPAPFHAAIGTTFEPISTTVAPAPPIIGTPSPVPSGAPAADAPIVGLPDVALLPAAPPAPSVSTAPQAYQHRTPPATDAAGVETSRATQIVLPQTRRHTTAPTTRGRDLVWNLGQINSHMAVEVVLELRVVSMPIGAAMLLEPTVSVANLTPPVTAVGGAVVLAQPEAIAAVTAPRGVRAQLTSADGRVTVTVPESAAPRELRLTQQYLRGARSNLIARGHAVPPSEGMWGRRAVAAFVLEATDQTGAAVRQFAAPLTLAVQYTPEHLQVLGVHEADLTLAYYDDQQATWVALPTTVDRTRRVATAQVDHFTPFTLSDGSSPSRAFVPTLQGFQVSNFTGAVNYSIPIRVPAGPAGLTPQIALDYSSAGSDGTNGARYAWQAGSAGKGWMLTAGGSVSRVRSNVGASWDYFTVVLGGRAFDLVKGRPLYGHSYASAGDTLANWSWHPVDDSFVQARYDGSAWQITTKDGTRSTFGQVLVHFDGVQDYEGQWLLTQVTDPHGNVIVYSHKVAMNGHRAVAHHLSEIYWTRDGATPGTGSSRYRVRFDTGGDNVHDSRWHHPTQGVDTQWEYFGIGSYQYLVPREVYRLNAIIVEAAPSGPGAWQLVRRYHLTYAPTHESVHSDVGNGQAVLTLRHVQEFGTDGSSAFAAHTFNYYGNHDGPGRNRLEWIDNGQGGRVTFWYEWAIAPPYHWRNYHRVFQTYRQETSGQAYASRLLTRYDYTGAALNSIDYAATVWWATHPPSGNGNSEAHLARRANSEFRGHATVSTRVYNSDWEDPNQLLRVTVAAFHQGDAGCQVPLINNQIDPTSWCFQEMARQEAWKGKLRSSEVRASVGGAVLQRTDYAYTRISLPRFGSDSAYPNAEADSNHYQRAGLWRAFNDTSRTTVATFNGTGTAVQRITEQYYAPNGGCHTPNADAAWRSGSTRLPHRRRIRSTGRPRRATMRWIVRVASRCRTAQPPATNIASTTMPSGDGRRTQRWTRTVMRRSGALMHSVGCIR